MQTKNVNVVQPSNNKIEKNAVAAAANQNGGPAVVNGITGNSTNSNSGINSIISSNSNALHSAVAGEHNAQNGSSAVNGSSAMGPGSQFQSSTDSSPSTVVESTVTIPGVNGTTMTVSAVNGLNLGIKSPYQYLHLTSPNHFAGLPPPSHQHISNPSPSSASHQHGSMSSSPYQPLPVTSKNQQHVSTSSSVYQHVPVTSPSHNSLTSSSYPPPPLPPRVGSSSSSSASRLGQLSHEASSAVHSINTSLPVHSAYKPVPPPKPFVGPDVSSPATSAVPTATSGSSSVNSNNNKGATSTLPPPVPFHQSTPVEQLREQLATVTGSTLQSCGTPPVLSHILVTDQGQFHTHSTKFPNSGVEDRDHLVNAERQSRYLDGIDNPALLDDSHMPSYRSQGVGGGGGLHGLPPSGIPPEGTLAGTLPPQPQPQSRPYESPFASRPPFHPSQPSAQQNAAHQSKFTRESWMRNSQDQRAGIVELHPPQGHIHMNGHGPHHSVASSHIPNSNHIEGHYNHSNNHSNHISGHHSHMNGHRDHNVGAMNQNNKTSATDENQVNGAHEQRNDSRKDDKWGSLTRGIAARKYQNLKEKLSHKFRGDKPEDRANNTPYPNDKNSAAQNQSNQYTPTNNSNANLTEGNSQQSSSRDSFRRAIHQSSQNGTHQDNVMETNLSNQQTDGLPPQYPRSPSQYRPPQQLPPTSHSHSSYQAGATTHHTTHHHHDSVSRGMAMRRSGSYHHLSQHHQDAPQWRSHHYSVDNLVDAQAIPSDHTYSGPAIGINRSHPSGSGGSDSGRGTTSAGNEARAPNTLDTSLDSAASQRPNAQGHSSGNDSEWVDMTDTELQRIMKKGGENKNGGRLMRRESLGATPPLPPLSPEGTPSPSPRASPTLRSRKHSLSYSCGGLNKPDLLEAAGQENGQRGVGEGRTGNSSQGSSQSTPRRASNSHTHHNHTGVKTSTGTGVGSRGLGVTSENWAHRKQDERRVDIHNPLSKSSNRVDLGTTEGDLDAGEITSTTDALDLDSMLDGGVTEATSDDDATSAYDPDVHLIRKQLEGLEGMYSEVLKLLGGGRRGGRNLLGNVGTSMLDSKASRRRLHGSLSSLPSSIVSSRPGRDKRRVIDDRVRKVGRDNGGKTIHKRFQRLESHVVTLARSVAHLSSEMRTQHLMLQEIESIRGELASLRTGGNTGGSGGGHTSRGANHASWESFRAGIPGLSNPGRVKKLTQFFGDEPPLVRIFLRKLGYEKYAGLFEQEKIGMLELPYLTEERLQKIGIPMGPRLRILQEAQGPIRKDGNLSVYVV